MACGSCSTGQDKNSGIPAGCNNNGSCGTGGSCNKLNVFDWLGNMSLPDGQAPCDVMEIRFKNSRKEFYRNVNNLTLNVGDIVATESSPGHDIGVVSVTGELVRLQLKKKNVNYNSVDIKKIYRKAKQQDIDKWREAQGMEVETMFKARTLALKLGLQMKISDVEYQGDKSKAVFYYTADGRVDFRELIKVMADEFKVRIEMRQIGARQEAARLGAIGSCGRELCCSTWLNDFRTVSTSAARYQQLSLNPLKLAGQCGKLKCCLNYELDSYLDALKEFPDIDNRRLATEKGFAFHQKTDIFKRIIWWSYTSEPDVFVPLSIARTKEIFKLNSDNIKPADLLEPKQFKDLEVIKQPDYENVVGQDSLTRFDDRKKSNNNRNKNNHNRKPHNAPKPGSLLQGANAEKTTAPQPKLPNSNQNKQATVNPNRPQQTNKPVHPNQNKPNPNQTKGPNPNQNKEANPNKPQHSNQNKPNNPNQNSTGLARKKPVHNHKPKPKPDGTDKV
ncbi:MAG: regulatory iron-sulfur-containing complex subunit RicT [Bacteroidota bacterium]